MSYANQISIGFLERYHPKDNRTLSGFHRPPPFPPCVMDYFRAISRECYEFQVQEMTLLMEKPEEFFRGMGLEEEDILALPDADDDPGDDDTILDYTCN